MKRWFARTLGALAMVATAALLPVTAEEDMEPGASRISKEVAEALLADARSRLPPGSPSPEITSVEAVIWGDTALGCPRPDEMAATRLTPGRRVLIRAGDGILEYHVADDGPFRLCLVGARAPAPEGHPYPGPRIPQEDAPEK